MSTEINEYDTVYAPPDTAIDDSGAEHATIQDAIDNASSWVLVGPGTFEENISIKTSGFSLLGSGTSTYIDASTIGGRAMYVEADNVQVESIRVNTAGGSDSGIVTNIGTKNIVSGVVVEDAGGHGISLRSNNSVLNSCLIQSADNYGVNLAESGCVASNCFAGVGGAGGFRVDKNYCTISNIIARKDSAGGNGLVIAKNDINASNIYVRNVDDDGVRVEGDYVTVSNFNVNGVGGDGLVVTGADSLVSNGMVRSSSGSSVNDGSATRPKYNNVYAGGSQMDNISASSVTDSTWVSRLVDSPNASIANAVLDNGDSAEVSVPVADTETLKVYRWGAYKISDGTTPTDLDVELKDGSDTVQASENTGDNESTDPANPVASHQNSSGSTSIYKFAISNDTGSTISDPGVGGFAAYIVE